LVSQKLIVLELAHLWVEQKVPLLKHFQGLQLKFLQLRANQKCCLFFCFFGGKLLDQ
jgi:hypothetical protein